MTYKLLRPDQGWPALFNKWNVGDSFTVCGNLNYVRTCIDAMNEDISKFKLNFVSPSLTRVTRTA